MSILSHFFKHIVATAVSAVGFIGSVITFIQFFGDKPKKHLKRFIAFLLIFILSLSWLAYKYDPISSITVTQVTLDKTSANLYLDESLQLTATVLYSDNTQEAGKENSSVVTWVSSDSSVADVDQNGYVTALSPGTAKITAQASKNNSTESDICNITVRERVPLPSGYSISLSSEKTAIGSQFAIYIEPFESNYTEILVHAESPSGTIDTYPWNPEKRYYIDTETGIWKIYATIINEAGRYDAHYPQDYATIEITPISFDSYIPSGILP